MPKTPTPWAGPTGVLALLLLPLMLTPATALGWGEDGHRIIAHIAESRLDNSARKTITELVGAQSVVDIATWADDVRRTEPYAWTAPLHYVNAPRGSTDVRRDRDCPHGRCVVGAIDRYAITLADTNAPVDARAEALKFLVHFAGDLHQPLHASYADDRGGNMIRVRFFGQDQNLHALWDSGLLRHHLTDGWERHAERLAANATLDQIAEATASLDPIDWACDSFTQTRTKVYELMNDSDELEQPYFDATIGIVDHQLTIGGFRLGAMLNSLIGDGAKAPDAFAMIEQADRLDHLRASMTVRTRLSAREASEALWNRIDGRNGGADSFWAGTRVHIGDDQGVVLSMLPDAAEPDLHLMRIMLGEYGQAGGSLPFGVGRTEGGRRLDGWGLATASDGTEVFSPPRRTRGDVARAILYGAVMAGQTIEPEMERMLRLWHESDAPDDRERARNGAVRSIQGNGNRFIDEPWLVRRIADF